MTETSSRARYKQFRDDYRRGTLDDPDNPKKADGEAPKAHARRAHVREYMQWLWPHRFSVVAVFLFALLTAGLQMIDPLFMRYIIDDVLLNTGLDTTSRIAKLNVAGAAYLGVILLSNLFGVLKDYRQRVLNVRVMLSLRRSLFDRLIHLPLARLWDMKTGGIRSRPPGDLAHPPAFCRGSPAASPPPPDSGRWRLFRRRCR